MEEMVEDNVDCYWITRCFVKQLSNKYRDALPQLVRNVCCFCFDWECHWELSSVRGHSYPVAAVMRGPSPAVLADVFSGKGKKVFPTEWALCLLCSPSDRLVEDEGSPGLPGLHGVDSPAGPPALEDSWSWSRPTGLSRMVPPC